MRNKDMRPLHEKVYLSCYCVPKSRREISIFLYGTNDNRRLSDAFNRLLNPDDRGIKWLDKYLFSEIPNDLTEKILSVPKGGREIRRNYYYAKPEPLFYSIIDDLAKKKVILSDIEENRLKSLLDSKEFRLYVNNHIRKHEEKDILNEYESNFLYIKQALCRHCAITNDYNYLLKKGIFSNQEEKQRMLKERLSNDEVNIIQEIADLMEDEPKEFIEKLSQLDSAVYSEIHKVFNMFSRFIEESLRIYNE